MNEDYFDVDSFVVQYEYSEQETLEYTDEQIDSIFQGEDIE